IDRKDADPERVLNETFDLFIELGASDKQADFPVVYATATDGRAGLTPELGPDLAPLFETILSYIPAPYVDPQGPFQLLITSLDYDSYRGLSVIGRIFRGTLHAGQPLLRMSLDGEQIPIEARYLYTHAGLKKIEIEAATAGEIVTIAGLEEAFIGETLADPDEPEALPIIRVEEPTVRMTFGVNTSPFGGREGRWGTSRKLRERLFNELKRNIALRVADTESADTFLVSGRGELHLAILIETMRREGYEFQISRPEVILKEDEHGKLTEPYEEVHIETTNEMVGTVVEMLGKRRGELLNMLNNQNGMVHMTFLVPTRGLLGFRYHFLTATRGLGVMTSLFQGYGPLVGQISSRSRGSLVAWETGEANTFGLKNAEQRGDLFIDPGTEVYEGMVIGEHQRPGDLDVNVCKTKHLTNMRNSIRDIDVRLTTPRSMSLDECIEYLSDDELLEVTPENLRIRKRILDRQERGRTQKLAKLEMAG
ncbi:MAG: EF-Tu/IF-2/RF-3 family GTPase, partial [Anaerolineales bacterium]